MNQNYLSYNIINYRKFIMFLIHFFILLNEGKSENSNQMNLGLSPMIVAR